MNFLVGLLLLVMPEERAFWVLCFIVEDLLQDYFIRSMRGLTVDQRVLEHMLERKIPRAHKQTNDLGFPLSIVTTRWHMCVFLNSLPTEVRTCLYQWRLLQAIDWVVLMCMCTRSQDGFANLGLLASRRWRVCAGGELLVDQNE
jgi:hypothetical protein